MNHNTNIPEQPAYVMEEVNKRHYKTYYHNILVYEIQYPDDSKPPTSVKYFYPNGNILIEYNPNADGDSWWGWWRLYDEAAQEVAKLKEDRGFFKKWDRFMPDDSFDTGAGINAHLEAVKTNIKAAQRKIFIREIIKELPVAEHLKPELEEIDWNNIETARGGGEKLPAAINGMLWVEEDIAELGRGIIWSEILQEGTLYESTYKVAIIGARMLPFYANDAIVQQRLIIFLFSVLSQPSIYHDKELYKELVIALNTIAPLIMKLATSEDENLNLRAQYLLMHTTTQLPEIETLLTQEWQDKQNSGYERAYAAFSLGYFYQNTDQSEKLTTVFSQALTAETDGLVHLTLAIMLVITTKKEALESWLAIIVQAFIDADKVDNNFYELLPFTGGYGVQEFMLMLLGYANPEVLEKNMNSVIKMLQDTSHIQQETLFGAIFAILFPDESALENITPLRKNALLAAAAVIEANPNVNYVNHNELFSYYGLPYDSVKLRELANGVG